MGRLGRSAMMRYINMSIYLSIYLSIRARKLKFGTLYRVVQNDYFFDNFGKSTPILTILSPLQQEIHGA